MSKKALITVVTGQDGAYLSKLLLEKGYKVYGLLARRSSDTQWRLRHLGIENEVDLMEGDLTDLSSLTRLLAAIAADEVYNLGAQSFVATSWMQPVLTGITTGIGAAKVFGHYTTVNYREAYDIHASSGILFNHEGPKRGLEFVTRKVTNAVARIKLELQDSITLGNLDSSRDWGYAGDYVEAMWMMLQQDTPDDYVIATGETHTIRELLERAFALAGIDDWESRVVQDPRFYRPAEVDLLIGDASKAYERLGWKPTVGFTELVHLMVDSDVSRLR